jgi:hypothetical protein
LSGCRYATFKIWARLVKTAWHTIHKILYNFRRKAIQLSKSGKANSKIASLAASSESSEDFIQDFGVVCIFGLRQFCQDSNMFLTEYALMRMPVIFQYNTAAVAFGGVYRVMLLGRERQNIAFYRAD